MQKTLIHIDESKCDGCAACVTACHEGAIGIVDGVARLLREDYCDGLGDCLPACPTEAISLVPAAEEEPCCSDEPDMECAGEGASGTHSHSDDDSHAGHAASDGDHDDTHAASHDGHDDAHAASTIKPSPASQLANWPIQLRLVAADASYLNGASLLIAADCTAFALAGFHEAYMAGRITLIGCPKLDEYDYTAKLLSIFKANDIRDVTVVRMQVPCCRGIEQAVHDALQSAGLDVPLQVAVLSSDGRLI